MKIITSILLLLMLFLVGQPVCSVASRATAGHCCDGGKGQGCKDDEEQNGDRSGDCAGCNPFQSCACCAVGMLPPPAPDILAEQLLFPVVDKLKLPTATQALRSAEPSGFWQPPRKA